ncbi:MAG: glycosyltransferase family 2 protein [Nitrospirae bacterium]|nr:glycosyltransferase family 2 protein [Nitrospirota bacterium]
MEDNNPLVSVIVRTKDRPKLLKRALYSIALQSYRPMEVVLVNDGGCDLDKEELKGILGDISLNYRRFEENRGRSNAANAGIEDAVGVYIGFLDDDDELYPEHIELLAYELIRNSSYNVAYSDAYMAFHEYDEASGEYSLKKKERFYSEDFDRGRLLFENYIPLLCLLFRRELFGTIRFEEDLHTHEDWRLLALISRENEFIHIKSVTCQYNVFGDSFANYLGSRYDIHKSASIVFERNREFMTWDAWMRFKNLLEDKVRDGTALNEHLKRETERYKTIEDMYNFVLQKVEGLHNAQAAAYDNQTALHQKYDHLLQKSDLIEKKMEQILAAQLTSYDGQMSLHSKLDQHIDNFALIAEQVNGRLDDLAASQSHILNRLSISERIKNLLGKLKSSSSQK